MSDSIIKSPVKLPRIPGWEARLQVHVESYRNRTFDRGTSDCVRFVSGAVFQMVGMDLARTYTERYRNDEEAKQLIAEQGQDGFFKLVRKVCVEDAGFLEVDWKHAHRGDVCFIQTITEEESWAGGLGICMGVVAYTPWKQGLREVAMRACRAVWTIPYA